MTMGPLKPLSIALGRNGVFHYTTFVKEGYSILNWGIRGVGITDQLQPVQTFKLCGVVKVGNRERRQVKDRQTGEVHEWGAVEIMVHEAMLQVDLLKGAGDATQEGSG